MMTMRIDTDAADDIPPYSWIAVDSTSSSVSMQAGRRVPSSIPASQRYYWTRDWQEFEAEAEAEIQRGDLEVFGSVLDLARDLLSDGD